MTTQIPNSMLVSPGGGLVQVGAIAASTTLAPNATAVQTAIAAAAGGAAAAIRGAASSVIQLDINGTGRAMPLVAGQTINITADYTPTIGAGAVLDGVCVADYISSGAGNLLLTNFNARGDTFAVEAGRMFSVTYFKRATGVFAIVQKGDNAATVPGQVTALTAGAATTTTQPLTWTAPVSTGGSPFTNYLIEYETAAAGTYTTLAHAASTVTAIVVTGLTVGTSYNYRVSAVNAIGTGVASAVLTNSTAAAAAGRTDTFARADENPINIPSDGGSAWLAVGTHGSLAIIGGVAASPAAFSIRGSALLFTGPNMTVSTTFRFSSSDAQAGLTARLFSTDSYGLRMNVSVNGTVTFTSSVSSVGSTASASVTVAAFVLETVHTMSASVVGDVYTCKIDGATIATFTSATYNTQLYGGIISMDAGIAAPVKFTAFSIA